MSLLRDPAHGLYEITSDVVLGLVLYLPAKTLWNRWHTRHDTEEHRLSRWTGPRRMRRPGAGDIHEENGDCEKVGCTVVWD